MHWRRQQYTVGLLLIGAVMGAHASTRPVPSVCNAGVNSGLATFVAQHGGGQESEQDNVMVCGTMTRDSFVQHAGHSGTGAHVVLLLSVPSPNGSLQVEVVSNIDLDGKVTARQGDTVFAYGQAYVDAKPIRAGGQVVQAGVHDTHCSTHAGADDGWIVVAGKRYPKSCPSER